MMTKKKKDFYELLAWRENPSLILRPSIMR